MKFFKKNKLAVIVGFIYLMPIGVAAQVGGTAGGDGLQNPIGFNTFGELVAAILNIVVTIGIPIAALFIIYAGFLFVTAGGNDEKLKKAKQALLAAVIGTAILLAASVIADAIGATIGEL